MNTSRRPATTRIAASKRVVIALLAVSVFCTTAHGGAREASDARSKARRRPGQETPGASAPRGPVSPAAAPAAPSPSPPDPVSSQQEEADADAPPPGTGAYEAAPKVSENRPPAPPAAEPVRAEEASSEREFPWPPLKASSKHEVPDRFFRGTRGERLVVADIATRLGLALLDAGYLRRSYLAVPEGFALVTRLERIRPDGTPYPEAERWLGDTHPLRDFTLSRYVETLSAAEPGLYRVLAFAVSPRSLRYGARFRPEEKADWLEDGLNRVPPSVSEYAYSGEYRCTAFVFELEKKGPGQPARPLIPGRLAAPAHLRAAGLGTLAGK